MNATEEARVDTGAEVLLHDTNKERETIHLVLLQASHFNLCI